MFGDLRLKNKLITQHMVSITINTKSSKFSYGLRLVCSMILFLSSVMQFCKSPVVFPFFAGLLKKALGCFLQLYVGWIVN